MSTRKTNATSEDRNFLYGKWLASPAPGDEIVVSGLSAKFPSCKNAYEIRDKLYGKKDLISGESRWTYKSTAMPKRVGIIDGLDLFDCSVFGLTPHMGDLADPMLRVCVETAVEAILDAGINPEDLAGTRTAVLGSLCNSETGEEWMRGNADKDGGLVAHRATANTLSYILKLNGPSFLCDAACSSSAYSLDHAYTLIRKGKCDAALIFSSLVLIDPRATSQFYSLGVLSPDGICKCFDVSADGYVRSEARCAILIQKYKDAKRVYAQILHSKTSSDGYKLEGITFPSGQVQEALAREVYAECGIDPKDAYFLEAHGTGTKVGDPEELNAIDRVFCGNRKEPLLIGSVKANLGHAEPAAALAALTKILLGIEAGFIAPNIHFKTPRPEVSAFKEGRIKVLLEKLPYKNQNAIISIGSYGFGGANGHLILRGFNKKQKKPVQFDGLPRLVCFGGRTETTIKNILRDLTERDYDPEYIALLQSIFRKSTSFAHPYRAFAIVTDKQIAKMFYQKQKNCSKQIFAVFYDFGDNWISIGQQLIKLPLFKNTIDRANNILSKINITLTISAPEPSNKFLINFTIQLGILDILKLLGINFTKIISINQSFEQTLAAYYQETITLEEALLTASTMEQAKKPKNPEEELKTQSKCDIFGANLPKRGTILEFGFGRLNPIGDGWIYFAPNSSDGFFNLLEVLGGLYINGFDLDLEKLYPAIQYPVSRGTPMISPLISWEHSLKKFKIKQNGVVKDDVKRTEMIVDIDINRSEWSFITGHVIDGRILFPATGYLFVVWKELAELHGLTPEEARVSFENVRFKRATALTSKSIVHLLITIFDQSGNFEICEGGTSIVTGCIKILFHDIDNFSLPLPDAQISDEELKNQDIYKELKLRGYNYNGLFKAVETLDQNISIAHIKWLNNWTCFMDNMLQLSILGKDTRNLYVPTGIDRIVINSVKHMKLLETLNEPLLPVYVYKELNYFTSGYIQISGVKASPIPKRKQLSEPVLEKYQFVPNNSVLTIKEALRVNIQIMLENHYRLKVKTIEVYDDNVEFLSPTVLNVLGDIPLMQPDVNILTNEELECPGVNLINTKLIMESDVFIVMGTNVLSKPQLLKDALTTVQDHYIITQQTASFDPEILTNNNLEVLTSFQTENAVQLLLRVVKVEANPSVIIKIPSSLDDFDWLELVQNAIKSKQNIILLAQCGAINGILGLFNCIRREYKTLNIRCVFITDEAPTFDISSDIYKEQLKKQFAVNILKNGKWGTYRHLLLDQSVLIESEHAYVNTLIRGDLSSLKWIEGPLKFSNCMESGKKLIQVYYASLNFRDIMTATGKLSVDVVSKFRQYQECVQGIELSGKDSKGRRFMGLTAGGSLSTIIADETIIIPIPDSWSLEDAVTVPVVYGTVLYAFLWRTKIKRGQSILIHAGSGGVGQAAIRIALHYGLHVYTTVGTEAKRQFVKDTFPQISDQQIGNSRDTSFEQLIMKQTKGRGVDLVLNSLAEEKLLASLRCVAKGGQFLEIGKFDLSQDNPLPLKCFANGVSYHSVHIDGLFDQSASTKELLRDLIVNGIQSKAVKPLTRIVFQKDEIEEAFRFMAAGKHMGKVLIELRKEEEPPRLTTVKCLPRYFCDPERTQVILGGLGGFGLELADWLVLRGARKLILTSRTGIKNGYQISRIRLWRAYGVEVLVSTANVTTKKGCLELIYEANKLGDIESIFNLAVVLQDAVLENQTKEAFKTSFEPKAIATTYLDEITRTYCPNLRTFVVFSSVSCGRGNAGQTNYGMANSIMERICEKRKHDGLSGLAIQWGAIADVGLVAEMQRGDVEMEIGGTLQQRLASCLSVLDGFLRQNEAVVSSMVVAEKRLGLGGSDNVIRSVANVLGIKDLKTVSWNISLAELGMDSMMAVEIKQMIETTFDVVLSSEELRGLNFTKLKEMMEENTTDTTKTDDNDAKSISELHYLIIKTLEEQNDMTNLIIQLKSSTKSSDGVPVVIFPGMEGTSSLITPLAAQLNFPILCCQYFMEQQSTVEEITNSLMEELYETISKNSTFKIICHSAGSLMALKMAEKLEANGKTGKLIFIDGTPDMIDILTERLIDTNSYKMTETKVLIGLSRIYLNSEAVAKFKQSLSTTDSYKEKVEKLFKLLPEEKQRYQKLLFTYIKYLIMRCHAFKISKISETKIKADCLLCKAADNPEPQNFLPEDYGLSKCLEKPPKIASFTGTHVTLLENPDLAKCINEFLN